MRSVKILLGVVLAAVFAISVIDSNQAHGGGIHTDVSTIGGEVIFLGNPPGPIVVEAHERPQFSRRPVSSIKLEQSGPYSVQVRPGSYYLRAFVDSNGNGRLDPGEPVGIYSAEQALVILPLASKTGINILIPLPKESTEGQRVD